MPAARSLKPRPAPRSSARLRRLADTAYSRLRDSIVTLRLAPGAPLTELDLCQRLGISRTPVRAALLRLEQEGLVSASRQRSGRMTVASLTPEDMRELFLMVGALDGAAARLAAALPEARRAAVVREGEALNARLRQLSAGTITDIRAAQELDFAFHRCYEQAAAGPRLMSKLDALHARRERYVRVYTEALLTAGNVSESLDEHGALLRAIADGRGDEAERLAVFNHRNGLDRYRRIVAMHGERGNWGREDR
ncbi:MAG TPA: GntR family transcriptional regulator [Vicinamibacterales bacterium]|nr:GntR family transcriptional regulator [Vicinamibacterales bacterium]